MPEEDVPLLKKHKKGSDPLMGLIVLRTQDLIKPETTELAGTAL